MVGQAIAVWGQVNFLSAVPACLGELLPVHVDLPCSVQLGKESQEKVGVHPPGLAAVVADAFDLEADLLHHLPADGVLCGLSDLRKPCNQGIAFVDPALVTGHEETVVLLSKLNTRQHIEVELNLDELDLTSAESKATYDEIKAYVLEKHGLKVSSLYISQVKRKCGLDVGQNYNLSKKEDAKVPQCPPEKKTAIMEALKHFQMI